MIANGALLARKGDYRFYKDVLDRLHGTPIQRNEHTGKDGKDLIDPAIKNKMDDVINIFINGNTEDSK